jgi:RHS repeat-associated protein
VTAQTTTTPSATTSASYTYDAAGGLATQHNTSQNETFTWNDEDQLTQVATTPAGGTAQDTTYTYNADGTVLLRADPASTTLLLGDEEIVLGTSGSVTATRYYSLGSATVASQTAGSDLQYLAGDQQDTESIAIDATTLNVTRRYYDPYGNLIGASGAWTGGQQGFVNGISDTATGLTDLGAREYQPQTGSFISPDLLLNPQDPQDLNAYSYSNDNPATYSDPTGLCPLWNLGCYVNAVENGLEELAEAIEESEVVVAVVVADVAVDAVVEAATDGAATAALPEIDGAIDAGIADAGDAAAVSEEAGAATATEEAEDVPASGSARFVTNSNGVTTDTDAARFVTDSSGVTTDTDAARFVTDSNGVTTDTEAQAAEVTDAAKPATDPSGTTDPAESNEPADSKLSIGQRTMLGAGIGAAGGMASGALGGEGWKQVLLDGAIGAATGAIGAAPPGVGEKLVPTVVGATVGGAAGFSGSVAMQTVQNGGYTGIQYGQAGFDAGLGTLPVPVGMFAAARGASDMVANVGADIFGDIEGFTCTGWSQGEC